MYIKRQAEKIVLKLAAQYPAVVLTGPRQSGKTTLVKNLFNQYPYSTLEDLNEREFARTDPRGFLAKFDKGGVIDEVQKLPELLSYLQSILDNKAHKKPIILTGSAQLSLLSKVTQTLSGRTAIIDLLPLSFTEIKNQPDKTKNIESLLFRGMYPRLYKENIEPIDWYQDYVRTYTERDVRDILNVHDLGTFQKFLKMCAARAGQILNLTGLSNDCGISHSAAASWLNILEATYIAFRIQPHIENFSKRLIRSPKLYFYDTGLLCHLLNIQTADELKISSYRGSIMENWVATEIIKSQANIHRPADLFFWRDNKGIEIDFIIDRGIRLYPLEVKSGQTIINEYFKNISYWQKIAGNKSGKGYIVYAGNEDQIRTNFKVYSWTSIESLIKETKRPEK